MEDEVEHLRERERDHDEIDAACPQHEHADDERRDCRDDHRSRQRDPKVGRGGFRREKRQRIGADSEERSVTEAHKAGVEKVVFASSGCVYPNFLQTEPEKELYLTEDKVGPPYDADNMYGWAKLMAEMTLKSYSKEYGMKTASCRYFTVITTSAVVDNAPSLAIARKR